MEHSAVKHDAGYVIETKGLTKTYGSKDAVKDINIHVREGEIYGLIGRNGAGKNYCNAYAQRSFLPD